MRFLSDQNFNWDILRGFQRRVESALDIITVQEMGLENAPDPLILERAAEQGCILLTHDISTMPNFAYERVAAGLPMPGMIVIPLDAPIGSIIDDLLMILEASNAEEYQDQVTYLPF